MKEQRIAFNVRIYKVDKGYSSLICPENPLKDGDFVVAFHPFQQVDPLNLYAFVSDENQTHSICRKQLKFVKSLTLSYTRKPLSTHTQETLAKLTVMRDRMKTYNKTLA